MPDLPSDPDTRDQDGRPRLVAPLPDEATPAGEIEMARNFLGFLRAGALLKIDGLDDEQIRWRPAPGANSIGALVMHLSDVERFWVRQVFAGEAVAPRIARAESFAVPEGWSTADVVAWYRNETAAADAVLDAATDANVASRASFRPTTLRWILFHLIEEIGRHVGHLDITRELIDGSRGR
jgi:uncharacterized damage-inducible protein DinB